MKDNNGIVGADKNEKQTTLEQKSSGNDECNKEMKKGKPILGIKFP